ncbi:MAG: lactate racemase domain-containing protein [Promethearchaeota archaeon]|jgi:nickel-dependent lactate racemase
MVQIGVKINEFFGDQTVQLEFPDTWEVKEVKMVGHKAPQLTDSEINDAFSHPIGTRTISELARGKTGKIVITVDDLTRPTPAYRVLPFIVKELKDSGVADDQILIIGAIGTHHPMNLRDFTLKVGPEIITKYDVVNHNPFEHFEEMGKTSYGTPLKINYELANADLKIVVCGLKKHSFGGAGGSGKAIIPGVASIDTIAWNHNVVPHPDNDVTANYTWKIKGNDPRADMQEAARKVGVDVTVNCTYNNNRELIGLHVGDLDDSWLEAVRFCYNMHSAKQPAQKADVVVVNAYPITNQGIDWAGARDSLKDGGSVVAITQHPWGLATVHYHEERNWWWSRLQGHPNRPWPVQQARQIKVYTRQVTMKEKLQYSEEVDWLTSWSEIIKGLNMHDDKTSAIVYHNILQFNPDEAPLFL